MGTILGMSSRAAAVVAPIGWDLSREVQLDFSNNGIPSLEGSDERDVRL